MTGYIFVPIADIIIVSKALFFVSMLSVSRSLCQKNLQQSATAHFIICSIKNNPRTWLYKRFLIQNKVNYRKPQYLKLQKCDFRTTQSLHIPPLVAMLLRPALRISALLMGRGMKKWWARKSEKDKAEYKQWFRERSNVFLGKFFRDC